MNIPGFVTIIRWSVAVSLVAVLLFVVGLDEIAANFSGLRFWWAISGVILLIMMNAIGGFNVWILLRVLVPIDTAKFIRAYLFGWAVGLVTPGQMGDAAQVLLLKKSGVEYAKSGAAYLLDKSISVAMLACIAFYGGLLYLKDFSLMWLVLFLFLVALISGGTVMLIIKLPGSHPYQEKLRRLVLNTFDKVLVFRRNIKVVLLNILLTFCKWLLLAICYYCVFRAFSAEISLRSAAFIPILSTLVGYIPISVGGIGTVELTAVYLFGLEGLGKPTVMSAYIFLRVTQYMLAVPFIAWQSLGNSLNEQSAGSLT